MKAKIIDKLKFVGEQLQHYAPFLEATGYEVSQIDITLSFGIIPSVTPIIEHVGSPDLLKMVQALSEHKASFTKLIDNLDETIAELNSIAKKAESFKNKAVELGNLASNPEAVLAMAENAVDNSAVGTAVKSKITNAGAKLSGAASDALNFSKAESSNYIEFAAEGIRLVAKNTKQPVVKKILNLLASLNEPGKQIEIPGYKISSFNVDFSVFPALSFSLKRAH